ncbi:hypothetical protein HQ865_20015 [Mucilaginibacter mali]|uniref:Alpha/beta hydrolase n=1 Tax=Mucilaginibacter mali TaxID=2740462 RepID=A0A7D4QHG8_9SPHI|nr:hypothetical protein [Mucilaginibacter mali]QKJ31952.1 hypothetical protein HQ865_20015 [Mucilaginibacter mali]
MRYLFFLFIILQASISLAQTDSIQTIRCDADTIRSYSLLLPKNYQKQQKYPVIFLFDPAARGKMVVGLYRKAATEYGFILIASNNSRNGPMGESLNAATAMFTDAFKKYSIDERQVYLAGFSGGARVATTIGLQSGGITGIIACSAGFSEPIPKAKLPWTLAAIAGNQDFNYVELQQVVQTLQSSGSVSALQMFAGPHRWPPVDVFMSALLWSLLQHQKQSNEDKIVQYRALIDGLIGQNISVATKANLYRQYLSIKQDADYAEKLKALETSAGYRDELAQEKQLMIKENACQQKIAEAFQQIITANTTAIKTKGWWKNELASLNKMLLSHLPADSNYVARQKAFIIANAAESFGNYYSAKRYDTAAELLTVSEVFEPENPLVYYRHALLVAADKDESGTLYYLKQAISHNFSKQPLRTEPAFGFLRDNKKFQSLVY